jgi:hypothetical protein
MKYLTKRTKPRYLDNTWKLSAHEVQLLWKNQQPTDSFVFLRVLCALDLLVCAKYIHTLNLARFKAILEPKF